MVNSEENSGGDSKADQSVEENFSAFSRRIEGARAVWSECNPPSLYQSQWIIF